jgi:GTP-binding protein
MFLDEAIIQAKGGAGGAGCVSWRREKYVPKGGPDGGDGGQGGNVIIQADDNTDTLSDYASRKKFEAPKGGYGSGRNKHGRDGEDLVLLVPPGTIIHYSKEDGSHAFLADLSDHGERVIVARGGRGGYGNAHFKSSVRQRPDFAERGEPGEAVSLTMELKLVADVGIIGYPSVGKSTLISVISGARPKIADYHFTTLVPNLGVVDVADRSYIVCDVPGLIEGASEGKGLGDAFLKHIERCGLLLHMLDLSHVIELGDVDTARLVADYRAIRKELEAYSPTLAAKREVVVLNKIDALDEATLKDVRKALKKHKIDVFAEISAATRTGTEELKKKLLPMLLEERKKRHDVTQSEKDARANELVVLRPHEDSENMGAFHVTKQDDGSIRVTGKRLEQFTVMTDFGSMGAIKRFLDVADRVGLLKALRKAGVQEGTRVFIGSVQVDAHLPHPL